MLWQSDEDSSPLKLTTSSTINLTIYPTTPNSPCIEMKTKNAKKNAISFGGTTNLGQNAIGSRKLYEDQYAVDYVTYGLNNPEAINVFTAQGSPYAYIPGDPENVFDSDIIYCLERDAYLEQVTGEALVYRVINWYNEPNPEYPDELDEQYKTLKGEYEKQAENLTPAYAYETNSPYCLYANGHSILVSYFDENGDDELEKCHVFSAHESNGYIYGEYIGDTGCDANGNPNNYTLDKSETEFWIHTIKANPFVHTANTTPTAAPAPAPAPYVNASTVTADSVRAIAASGATTITLGNKVKKIAPFAFAGTGIKVVILQTKKLKVGGVKNAFKGSSVKTVRVQAKQTKSLSGLKGKAKQKAKDKNKKAKEYNKKLAEKYKKFMTKKTVGKKVKVKA